MKELWSAVDEYFEGGLIPPDPVLEEALAASAAAGLPAISVTASQGRLLNLLARMLHARRILEIGTLGGYSTIWLARALPVDGQLITLEIDAGHAEVARRNLQRAGFADRVAVWVAPAAESLERLVVARVEPFDLVFIDADKASSDSYFRSALALSRTGALIVVDNVVRDGAVIDEATTDESIAGIRRLTELLRIESAVEATVIQTVGSKGYDGFALALVVADAPDRPR
jgi:predicted O-methyltransferase YrrM